DEKAVDDVFGLHRKTDVLSDPHVELVDLTDTFGMLELPHPLPADPVDLHGVCRGPREREEEPRAPYEHAHREHERNHGPDDLEHDRAPAVPVRHLGMRRGAKLL